MNKDIKGVIITMESGSTQWFANDEKYELYLRLCKGKVKSIKDCTLGEYEKILTLEELHLCLN